MSTVDVKLNEPESETQASTRGEELYHPFLSGTVSFARDGSQRSKSQSIGFPASLSYDSDAGVYVGRILALPGCVAQADSRKQAKSDLKAALIDILKEHERLGTRPTLVPPEEPIEASTRLVIFIDVENP